MTHDPLCPFVSTKAEIVWRPKCPNCVLIARVREDERSAALRDAAAWLRDSQHHPSDEAAAWAYAYAEAMRAKRVR